MAQAFLAIPDPVKWAVALIGVALGAMFVLRTDRVIAGLRRWLLMQMRWVRRPRYRRFVKIYGWLLLVTGALLALILILRR
ncbi:MAG TPA: hypothetical protein VK485_09695 [Sphingomicrobium sp.]|nr:hypothetical protein [Sphingomicrobium sp.]